MKRFASFDGTDIAYHEWGSPGEAPPIVLHHGFIADAQTNWVHPGVVDALVAVGGIGASVVEQNGLDGNTVPVDGVVAVLRMEDPSALADSPLAPLAAFRLLADTVGADREALVAVLLAGRILPGAPPIRLDQITAATLVLCGRDDPLATRPEVLARAIAGARLRLVEGDHLSALRAADYTPTLVEFMARAAPVMK